MAQELYFFLFFFAFVSIFHGCYGSLLLSCFCKKNLLSCKECSKLTASSCYNFRICLSFQGRPGVSRAAPSDLALQGYGGLAVSANAGFLSQTTFALELPNALTKILSHLGHDLKALPAQSSSSCSFYHLQPLLPITLFCS